MKISDFDRNLNELAHNLGMSRQHKTLVRELLVEMAEKCYHEGYEEGWEDHRDIMIEEWDEHSPDYNDGHDFWEKSE